MWCLDTNLAAILCSESHLLSPCLLIYLETGALPRTLDWSSTHHRLTWPQTLSVLLTPPPECRDSRDTAPHLMRVSLYTEREFHEPGPFPTRLFLATSSVETVSQQRRPLSEAKTIHTPTL